MHEDGSTENNLIRPMPAWTDWSANAVILHGITRDKLARDRLSAPQAALGDVTERRRAGG
jgi:hypothetical protein